MPASSMAGLSDLDFDPGANFEKLVLQHFGCTVSPISFPSPSVFHLVASFGRSAVRLNEDSVGLILQSCLGGKAKDFNVLHLSGWMSSFTVSCKNVGLLVRKLRSFSCKNFAIFFFLWGGGGPDWQKEYSLWLLEQDAEWTTVGSKPKGKSYADIVKSKTANSVFLRLRFPRNYQRNFLSSPSVRQSPDPSRGATELLNPNSNSKSSNPGKVSRWVPKLTPKSILGPAPKVSSAQSVAPKSSNPVSNSLAGPAHCSRCLGPGHSWKECSGTIRCRICFNYGHISKSCLARAHPRHSYRPISKTEVGKSRPVNTVASHSTVSPSRPPRPLTPHLPKLQWKPLPRGL